MKKIFLFVIALTLSLSPISRVNAGNTSGAELEQLLSILEQAKTVQKVIIAQAEIDAKYPYKMTVTKPNGGENFIAGEVINIMWNAVDSGVSKINIFLATSTELYKEKNPGVLIARDVPAGALFYPWTVPKNYTPGTYRILIRNSGKYKLSDYSDGSFSIAAPADLGSLVKITSIKGGETFITGRNHKIIWKTELGGERFVDIRLVKADSVATSTNYVYSGITEFLPSVSSGYDWSIPSSIPTGEYKFKIFGIDTGCIYCLEPQAKNLSMTETFKIINAVDMPNKITVFSPNGEKDIVLTVTKDEKTTVSLVPVTTIINGFASTTFEWATTTTATYATSTEKISWFTPFDVDSVDIFLRSIPSGRAYLIKNNFTSVLSATSSGVEIDWVPSILTFPDEKVVMRICRSGTSYCDESDTPFSILVSGAVTTPVAQPEPNTPEYSLLRDIVNKLQQMIEGVIVGNENEKVKVEEAVVPAKEEVSEEPVASYLPYTFSERLSIGLEDSDAVRALQEALTKEGLFKHAITGKFGEVTLEAVKAFQNKYELEPSGSTGPGTQAKLNELYGVKQNILQTVEDLVEAMKATTTPIEVD